MNASVATQKSKTKLYRKVSEMIKESKWVTSCKSMRIKILETQVMFPIVN